MKILLITQTLQPRSGLGRYSHEVYRSLHAAGVDVAVMAQDEVFELDANKKMVNILKNCLRARQIAKGYDIVHALDAWPYGIYALCAVWGTNKKLFVGGVGTYSLPPKNFSIKRLLLLSLYRRAQEVFCISEYTKSRIASRLSFNAALSVVHLAARPSTCSAGKHIFAL